VDGKPGKNYVRLLFISRIFIMDNHLFRSKLREQKQVTVFFFVQNGIQQLAGKMYKILLIVLCPSALPIFSGTVRLEGVSPQCKLARATYSV
jgi:hypothetical protein